MPNVITEQKRESYGDALHAAPLPRISVIIPCYNQGHYLAEAIDSVLNQTYPHVEIIVVDDGSTDNTPEVAARYGERIQYVYKPNAGLSAARNTGILHATGEFLHFLDSDDCIKPEMLRMQMDAFAATPTGTVFYAGWQEVDMNGRVIAQCDAPSLSPDPFRALLSENLPVHCYSVRRAALANVGLFDVHLPACEDWDLWLRLAAARYEFVAASPGAVAVYRRHPDSMSGNILRMFLTRIALYDKQREYNKSDPERLHLIREAYRKERELEWEVWLKQAYMDRAHGDARAAVQKARRLLQMRPRYLFDLGFMRFFFGTWKRTWRTERLLKGDC